MNDIAELERRITAALDRAYSAVERLSAESSETQDSSALAAELEAERDQILLLAGRQLADAVGLGRFDDILFVAIAPPHNIDPSQHGFRLPLTDR